MATLAYFGINSSGLTLVVDLLIVFVVVLYCSLVYWTYADARRRVADPVLVAGAFATSLFFPFLGTLVYMVLRPPEYLEDVRERELEMQAAEARLYELDYELCPHCDYRIERDFVRCPSCLRKLKDRCVSCSRPLDRAWTICPYCETEVAPVSGATSRARRRRSIDPETQAARTRSAGASRGADPDRAPVPASRTPASDGMPTRASQRALADPESSSVNSESRLGERESEPAAPSSRSSRPRPGS